jgi:hypothetical protein
LSNFNTHHTMSIKEESILFKIVNEAIKDKIQCESWAKNFVQLFFFLTRKMFFDNMNQKLTLIIIKQLTAR